MLSKDRIGALAILTFSLAYGFLAMRIPLLSFQAKAAFTARTMPEALTVLGVVLSLLLLFKPGSDERPQLAGFNWRQGALVCLLMVAYGLTIRSAGFLISTTLFLILSFTVLGERRPLVVIGVSVPMVVAFWALLSQFLGVFLGPWPDFLRG